MNIDSFPADFTTDLESFVKTPIQFTPLTAWDERRIAAPERHFFNGVRDTLSPTTISFLLENHNPAFSVIENLLQIFINPSVYASQTAIDVEKEQIWLFGWHWLNAYYNLLMNPTVVRSMFYKYENSRFISLMRQLLHPDPSKRITFQNALELWYPQSILCKKPEPVNFAIFDESENDSPSTIDPAPAVHTSAHDSSACDPPPSVPSLPLPAPRRRLVLKQSEFAEERNKTRKNYRN